MKLTCDLCGGTLQMNAGGQGATCMVCGLGYSMDRLREMLRKQKEGKSPAEVFGGSGVVSPVQNPQPVEPKHPFRMTVADSFAFSSGVAVTGTVAQGSVSVGDTLLLNGKKECRVSTIACEDSLKECAEVGMSVCIVLDGIVLSDVKPGDKIASVPAAVSSGAAASPVNGRRLDGVMTPVSTMPRQFVMQVSCAGKRGGQPYMDGVVQQGCVGWNDEVWLDNDMSRAYPVVCLSGYQQGVEGAVGIRPGCEAELYLQNCTLRRMDQARVVTGKANPKENLYHFDGEPFDFFASILLRSLPGYEIYANVKLENVALPATFCIRKGNSAPLAVFLTPDSQDSGRYKVERAMKACKKQGIESMQFFVNYRNDADYVADRVRKALSRMAL